MSNPYDTPKSKLNESDDLGFWRRQFKDFKRYFHNGWVWIAGIALYVFLSHVLLPLMGLHNVLPLL